MVTITLVIGHPPTHSSPQKIALFDTYCTSESVLLGVFFCQTVISYYGIVGCPFCFDTPQNLPPPLICDVVMICRIVRERKITLGIGENVVFLNCAVKTQVIKTYLSYCLGGRITHDLLVVAIRR